MGVETVVNIADLVVTNPTASDPKSQGDDHLRYLKTALKNDFAGFTGAVLVTGVDGGAADVYTLTPAHAVVTYTAKMLIEFTPAATNLTTTPTLNISGLGAKTIKSVANAALVAGDLLIGAPTLLAYDGTNLRLLGPTKNYIDQVAMSAALPAGALGFLRNDGAGVSAFTQTHTGYAQKEVKGADIACAATVNLTTATGNLVHLTGSTGPVTAITVPVGAEYTVVCDGTPTFTHSASLLCPGGVDLVAAADTRLIIRGDTAGALITIAQNADGTTRWNPCVAKAWIKCDAAGAIQASHNITSITDNGTGDVTITIATDFASANYVVSSTVLSGGFQSSSVFAQAAGSVQIKNWTVSGGSNQVVDPTNYHIICFGV